MTNIDNNNDKIYSVRIASSKVAVVHKIVVNQGGTAFFTVGQNQIYNVAPCQIADVQKFSVGAENVSLGLYTDEARATSVLCQLMDFLLDENAVKFQLEKDE